MLGSLETRFSNCQLLIVDETSMVSNVDWLKVSRRLQEIKKDDRPFGGVFVVCFGDLLQLPPVRLGPVFQPDPPKLVQQIFQGFAITLDIWSNVFRYRELTINMRQKDDLIYSEILGRIRIGSPTVEDVEQLVSRMISCVHAGRTWSMGEDRPRPLYLNEAVDYYIALTENIEHFNKTVQDSSKKKTIPLAVFAYTKTVTAFNDRVLRNINRDGTLITIEAKDTFQVSLRKTSGKFNKPFLRKGYRRSDVLKPALRGERQTKLTEDAKKCGELVKTLTLQEGCRVMLTRNLDIQHGLVNGSLGILERIESVDEHPYELRVKFDHVPDVAKIKKQRAVFNLGPQTTGSRTQFPIVVAYAMTIHKCQGVSCNDVVTCLADLFCPGQGYVALSRATNLGGIHLVNFHPASLYANKKCVEECDRLRGTIGLPSLGEPNVKSEELLQLFGKKNSKWNELFISNATDPTDKATKKTKKVAVNTTAKPKGRGRKRFKPIEESEVNERGPIGAPKIRITETDSMEDYVPGYLPPLTPDSSMRVESEVQESAIASEVKIRGNASGKRARTTGLVEAGESEEIIRPQAKRPKTRQGKGRNDSQQIQVPVPAAPRVLKSSSNRIPYLENTSRARCYANTSVQVLVSIWKDVLPLPASQNNILLRELLRLSRSRKVDSVQGLFNLCQVNTFNYNVMNSASEYLHSLIEFAPAQQRDAMTSSLDDRKVCRDCGAVKLSNSPKLFVDLRCSRNNYTGLGELFEPVREVVYARCDGCGDQDDHAFDSTSTLNVPDSTKLLVLEVGLFLHENYVSRRLENRVIPIQDVESLAGGNWAPVAAIQHFGDTAYIGHYTAFIRDGDGWVYCNDLSQNRITPWPQGLPQDLADVAILVLKRLDNVTTEQAVLQVDDISARQDADINKSTEEVPPPPAEAAPQVRSKPKTRVPVKRDKPTGRAGAPPSGVQEEAHLPTVRAAPQPSAPILHPANRTRFTVNDDQVLSIVNGDMFKERAGAIVNAANAGLQSGGGVCGLIFQNAGHAQMEKACKELRKKLPGGKLKGGMAVTTLAFGLDKQFDYVIHTAAPNVSGRDSRYNDLLRKYQAEDHLRDCYINALKEADTNNVDSIVLSILGVGIYGYDLRQGIAVAMQSILSYYLAFPESSVRVTTICVLSESHYNLCTMLAGDMTELRASNEESKVAFREMIEYNALAGQPPTGFINFMDKRMPSFVVPTLPPIPPPIDQEATSRPKGRASVKRKESTGRPEALPSPPAKKMSSSGNSLLKGMVSRILRSSGKKPTKK